MPIMLKRKDGSITPYRNSEFIPAYYLIPRSFLVKCGKELNALPRQPFQVFRDWDAIATVESDLFRQLMMDGYAHLVWPYMMGGEMPREVFSGYDPAWILAHSPGYWVQELTDEGIIPTVETLYQSARPKDSFGDVSLEELDRILRYIVPKAMEHYRMNDVLDVVEEYRCFEDFDTRKSNAKTDFFRKWYHTRTKYQTVSWEDYIAENEGYSDGATPEETAVSKVLVEQFFATLSEKDRRILELRMDGVCLEDIAKELGYSNHSGVLKRIQRIGQAYEAFTQTDLGFSSWQWGKMASNLMPWEQIAR